MGPATPRDKPFFIDDDCDECGETLVLGDVLEGNEQIWYDEWVCPKCQNGIFMDWPPEEVARLTAAAEGDQVTVAEMLEGAPEDFPFESEEELRQALGLPEGVEIKVSRNAFEKPIKRGDC